MWIRHGTKRLSELDEGTQNRKKKTWGWDSHLSNSCCVSDLEYLLGRYSPGLTGNGESCWALVPDLGPSEGCGHNGSRQTAELLEGIRLCMRQPRKRISELNPTGLPPCAPSHRTTLPSLLQTFHHNFQIVLLPSVQKRKLVPPRCSHRNAQSFKRPHRISRNKMSPASCAKCASVLTGWDTGDL